MIIGHDAVTARRMGWDRLHNGTLLATAEAEGFAVRVYTDA